MRVKKAHLVAAPAAAREVHVDVGERRQHLLRVGDVGVGHPLAVVLRMATAGMRELQLARAALFIGCLPAQPRSHQLVACHRSALY